MINREETKKKYYKSGNLKNNFSLLNGLLHGEQLTFHENGQLKIKANWVNGVQNGVVVSFDENGNKIKKSIILDGDYEGEQIEWYPNGKIKACRIYKEDIVINSREYDEDGKLIKEFLLKNGDSRMVLMHEVMTKGGFSFELKDGTQLEVFGQRHSFVEIEEFYEDGQWNSDGNRDYIDEFCLTGYDEGYMYDENDLYELFDLPEGSYPEWSYNGWQDWEETAEDWNNFKSKFSIIKSKDQFEID